VIRRAACPKSATPWSFPDRDRRERSSAWYWHAGLRRVVSADRGPGRGTDPAAPWARVGVSEALLDGLRPVLQSPGRPRRDTPFHVAEMTHLLGHFANTDTFS